MTDTTWLVVNGEASSGLLCRILGLLAQLDLPAPQMTVTIHQETMAVEMWIDRFGDHPAQILANKAARLIGIEHVCLNGLTIPAS
ncbi:MAG: hypothetical protein HEQ21_07025 [Blastomonas sp.]|uniref:ACT domain-containing protein n=1 Tax=Sphingosinicella microcystinivorans TaxID=335406 RepID=A0ABX9SUC0_SPHMI|nr:MULTISPECIES: hypothetical protein [Sphingomonadales]MCO5792554.1 hypothetical protein [Blastomonas sp.]RKS84553.1 hypothetical protein DFR51_3646 [Sphingosinicella microcystinivorans]